MDTLKSEQGEFSDKIFKKVDLHGETLSEKRFDECSFVGCNFSEAKFVKCRFYDCEFKDCNLSTTRISACGFRAVIFKNCKLVGVNWTLAAWSRIPLPFPIEFDGCLLDSSTFSGLHLQEIKMEGCRVHNVDFSNANCEYASFIQSDFDGSIFENTNLSRADFTDATNYHINVSNNKVEKAIFTLPEAIRLLDSLGIQINE